MRRIEYRLHAVTRARPRSDSRPRLSSRAKVGGCTLSKQSWTRRVLLCATLTATIIAATTPAIGETRPHYGGTLHVMMQSAPNALNLSANTTSAEYWDIARALSLIGDTLVKLDVQGRPQPALATAWQSDAGGQHWQFTLRRGVRFHDGSAASPAAIAQILGALHSGWTVRSSADSISIESDSGMPSLLAELALPRNMLLKNMLLKSDPNGLPLGTGAFLVAEWKPGKLLRLAANEESWAGRPFVDAVEIEFGKSLRDQAIALELDKADVIEAAPQAASVTPRHDASLSLSLPVELLALVFPANSKAQDVRLRQALALAIDRKPIQSVLLKGAGEQAATILPNWMTGYTPLFSALADPQRARTLLADSRQPVLNLSYDPRDPQAQLVAERIALNAREVGLTVQVSLSGIEDIRLMRVSLPSPDPATSLIEAARQLGLLKSPPTTRIGDLDDLYDDLYQEERRLLDGYAVIPLFHLPVASATGARVRDWEPGRLGVWSEAGSSITDLWLSDTRSSDPRVVGDSRATSSRFIDSRFNDSPPRDARPKAGSQ